MERFEITILGCGSATPAPKHLTSSQIVNIREKTFMIDCGEGTQIQMRRSRVAFAKLNHIFISHLHGDHCFGLLGIISSFGLLGRTAPLFVHAPHALWAILKPELDFYCNDLSYNVEFHGFDAKVPEVVYEDRSLTVTTIPLKHRVPCAGFLFREKPTTLHLNREMADFYGVPVWQYNSIKDGEDFITADGTVIPNSKLTLKGREPRSYAYCCDTMYDPSIVPLIHSSTLLYHDSTYGEPDKEKAVKYFHSTAAQAAEIAKAAGVERLMLGHFSARYSDETVLLSEAQAIFPETMLARETLTVSISG